MMILSRAPMLAVLGALAVSAALFDRFGVPFALLLAPLLAAGLSLCSYADDYKEQFTVLVLVMLAASLCSARMLYVLTRPELTSHPVKAEGIVSLVRPWGKRSYAAVIDTPEGGFLIRLPFATLAEGTHISVEGTANPLSRAKAPGGFDESRYWQAHGASARLTRVKIKELSPVFNIHALRYALYRKLAIYLPKLTSSYLRAAFTGQTDQSFRDEHRTWGTSHILAVSGFHVGTIVLCASFFFGKNLLALSLVMWAYTLLTGAAPGALRAALMIQSAMLARPLGRPASPLNGVCLAAVIMLSYCPFFFWDTGWRLSVLSAMTLAAVSGAGFKTWLLVSPIIALVTFPQSAYIFDSFPLAGLILNLFAPAFFALAFPVAGLAALIRFLNLPFAAELLTCVEGGFRLWGIFASGVTRLIPWTLPWGPFSAWLGAGTFFLILCRCLKFSVLRTWLFTIGGALVSFWLFQV